MLDDVCARSGGRVRTGPCGGSRRGAQRTEDEDEPLDESHVEQREPRRASPVGDDREVDKERDRAATEPSVPLLPSQRRARSVANATHAILDAFWSKPAKMSAAPMTVEPMSVRGSERVVPVSDPPDPARRRESRVESNAQPAGSDTNAQPPTMRVLPP